jgi:hypothetical protein
MASISRKIPITFTLLLGVLGCYDTTVNEDSSTQIPEHDARFPKADGSPNVVEFPDSQTAIHSDATPPPTTDAQKDQSVDSKTTTPRIPIKHRAVGEECNKPTEIPEPDAGGVLAPGNCSVHADCIEGIDGRCIYYGGEPGRLLCAYDNCFKDSDCGDGVCECLGGYYPNTCRSGNCQIDADCGPDGYCSPSNVGCSGTYFYCHTPEDECVDDTDCNETGVSNPSCYYNPDVGKWICGSNMCMQNY